METRFYLHTKVNKNGEQAIYAEIRSPWMRDLGSSRHELRMSTGETCHPDNFDPNAKSVVSSKQKGYIKSNLHLRKFENSVTERLQAAKLAKKILSKEELRKQVLEDVRPEKALILEAAAEKEKEAKPKDPVSLRDWFEVWAKNNRGRVTEKHIKNGRVVMDHLERFAGEAFPPSDINESFIADYHEYLAEKEEIFDRTAAKHIGFIKSTLTQAGVNVHGLQWLDISATKSSAGIVFTREEQALISSLDVSQLSKEQLKPLPKKGDKPAKEKRKIYTEMRERDEKARRASLELAQDLMIFIFKVGARWSDLQNLDPSSVHEFTLPGGKVVQVLEYYQIKGGKQREFPCRVALDEEAAAIVAKYQGKQKKLLPVPSNQKLNEAMKDVCRLAGINAPIKRVRYRHGKRVETSFEKWDLASCHRCRATCATNLFEGGADDRTVQDVLGHDDPRSTRIYVRNADREQFAKTLAALERLASK